LLLASVADLVLDAWEVEAGGGEDGVDPLPEVRFGTAGPGEVGDAGVDRDHEVEMLDQCRSVNEALKFGAKVKNIASFPKNDFIAGTNILLKTNELRFNVEER